jgi:glycosyltransferase involved in cell wall biosynthesis
MTLRRRILDTVYPLLQRTWPAVPTSWRAAMTQRWREGLPNVIHRLIATELRCELAKHAEPSFLFLPTQTWFHCAFQRPQQLARGLASLGSPVIYVEPWYQEKQVLAPEAIRERRFVGFREFAQNLYLLHVPPWCVKYYIAGGAVDAVVMLWPDQADWFPREANSLLVYETVDDHSLFPERDHEWDLTHARYVTEADVVTATADDLLKQLYPQRPDVMLLPNAVHMADWCVTEAHDVPEDLRLARRAGVVVVYYGFLAEWFDWPMWEHAAAAKPEWSFVLIGAPYDGDAEAIRARVGRHPNMFYLGPKPYAELSRYMAHVDVATIPFLLNDITHACSPVKLFEYMAAAKPIVTTPMREVLKYESVLTAATPSAFVRRLEEALRKRGDPEYLSILKREAEKNTWQSRADMLRARVKTLQVEHGGIPRRKLAVMDTASPRCCGDSSSLL